MSAPKGSYERECYNSGLWKRTRLLILARDNYTCTVCEEHHQAQQVDHIVPISKGGAPFDPNNLRSICKKMNVSRANIGRSLAAKNTNARVW